MWGFVLLNVSAGKETDFFANLGSIRQVRRVFYLFDDYDYLVEVEADSEPEISWVMTEHVRHLPGVERTATYVEGSGGAVCPVEHGPSVAEAPSVWQ